MDTSAVASSIKSYQTLRDLDLNGDNKVTGKEVNFFNKLGAFAADEKLRIIPVAAGAEDKALKDVFKAIKDLPPKDQAEALKALITELVTYRSTSSPITMEDLQNVLDKYVPAGDKDACGKALAAVDPSLTYNESTQKIVLKAGQNFDPTFSLKVSHDNLKVKLDLVKDVLDGNSDIKDVNSDVAAEFMGKQDSKVKTYQSANFDPGAFADFDLAKKIKVKNGDQEVIVDRLMTDNSLKEKTTDLKTGEVYNVGNVREKLIEKFPDFKKFAEDNKLFLPPGGQIDPSKLDLVKDFVSKISDQKDKVTFVSMFLTGNFVHSGIGASQQGVDQSNFTKILAAPDFPKEKGTGRLVIDCQFYAALAQKLLSTESGDQGLKAKGVVITVQGGPAHEISFIRDDANKKYYIQSNNEIGEVTMAQLKATGYNPNSTTPPTDEQIFKAAKYQRPISKVDDNKLPSDGFLSLQGNLRFQEYNKDGNVFNDIETTDREINGQKVSFVKNYRDDDGTKGTIDKITDDGTGIGITTHTNGSHDVLLARKDPNNENNIYYFEVPPKINGKDVNWTGMTDSSCAKGTIKDKKILYSVENNNGKLSERSVEAEVDKGKLKDGKKLTDIKLTDGKNGVFEGTAKLEDGTSINISAKFENGVLVYRPK